MGVIDYDFKKEEWEFERSSGSEGYRNKVTGEWVYSADYHKAEHDLDIRNAKSNPLMKTVLIGLSKLNKVELKLIEQEMVSLKRKAK